MPKNGTTITFEDFRNALINRTNASVNDGNIEELQKLQFMTQSMRSANIEQNQQDITKTQETALEPLQENGRSDTSISEPPENRL